MAALRVAMLVAMLVSKSDVEQVWTRVLMRVDSMVALTVEMLVDLKVEM